MKTILVPTDLSPITIYALDVAADIARTYDSEIILLHTVLYGVPSLGIADSVTGLSLDMGPLYADAWKEAEKALHELVANPAYADVTIKPVLGSNIEGLINAINAQQADLIVLASKGASGLLEWIEGSHAEFITRFATCPVLVVKEPVGRFSPQEIVFGIDLDEELKKPHLFPFRLDDQFCRQYVYVVTPTDNRQPEGIREWVGDFTAANDIDHYNLKIIHDHTVPDGILDYAHSIHADLIVLYTHGYTGLRHWIQGSVAEDVLNHADIPVLIMRA
ncbi:universal stress protein [Spirosoma aerolatum]|uniref:universal stress protein n=1 Tax=Spirosoma aerolatum TaxID=1211326 RepID=UPI0009AEBB06|nr:universal stress protein [Spirosoma aerolatum]